MASMQIGNATQCLRICSDYLLLLRFHPRFHPYTAAKRVQNRETMEGTTLTLNLRYSEFSNDILFPVYIRETNA